jgi:type IV pilus assembly protein PilY1
MLFFGTGQYVTDTDSTNTDTNSFYGIWDNGSIISTSRATALVEQVITGGNLSGEEIRTMTNNPVNYTTHRGWFVDLPDKGERVVARAIPVGDIVLYNTIVPESDFCSSSGGYSWFMAHNLLDGSEPDFIALDVNGDGLFDSNDQSGDQNVSGIKSDNIEWELTFLTGGGGTGSAVAPSADITQYGVAYDFQQGRRASWGRFMTE